jgi:tRNA-dihydrouridine synthase
MHNFWLDLQNSKPAISVLAPMEDVTDTVFRQTFLKTRRPDVFYTEFTSVEGINSIGQAKVIHRLKYHSSERPIIAQIWGVTPEDYFKAAELVLQLGFDGLDINMGCPVKNVTKMGACSALINNPDLALKIVNATKMGLRGKIPLSIKTRLGFKSISTDNWIKFVIDELKPNSLTIHARTVKEESKVPAHWDQFSLIKNIKNDRDIRIQNSLKKRDKESKISRICNFL